MKIRTLILGLAMLLSTVNGFAQIGGIEGGITWRIENDTLFLSGERKIPGTDQFYQPPWWWYNEIITAIMMENGITGIGDRAFMHFSYVTSLSIPNSVRSIGEHAFYNCESLTLITNLNPVPVDISHDVFTVDISKCTLEVPIKSVSAYQKAEVWKEFNIVGIEVGIKEFEDSAIEIYPNPTNGKVFIETESDIKVYTLQGELLQETFGNQVDLSTYPQGVYLLQVNGKWRKVVKR